jgi:DmsE family decaheme c-type cytochrome
VSCTDCHSPHHAKTAKALLSQKQPELCYGCHAQQKAEFNKPFHHRVNEGLVTCGDCHNMHGGVNGRSLRSAKQQDQVCFKCHTDKQGPWVFEHAPVRTDGCSSCHTAHGSNNVRLLKVNSVASLCLQCHTRSVTQTSKESGTPIANPVPNNGNNHNLTSRYYECTLCHTGIHGSNASNRLFK